MSRGMVGLYKVDPALKTQRKGLPDRRQTPTRPAPKPTAPTHGDDGHTH
jgi:hypothetical protein